MAVQPKTPRKRVSKTTTTPTQTAPTVEPKAEAQAVPASAALPKGKLGALVGLLRRPEGARLDELMSATGWQAHSVRGAMSGAVKKKLGFAIASDKTDGARIYRIVQGEAA